MKTCPNTECKEYKSHWPAFSWDTFCSKCGTRLIPLDDAHCPKCNNIRFEFNIFCPNCGHEYKDDENRQDENKIQSKSIKLPWWKLR